MNSPHLDLETAILLPVPPDVLRIAYPLAKQYAPRMIELYPLHLTLLWPFAPMEHIDEGCARLASLAQTLAPVSVTFNGYGVLGRSTYMNPLNPQPLIDLFRRVYDAFPECQPYYGAHGDTILPHLTVGLFRKESERAAAVFPDYTPLTFTVDRLHIFYGPRVERLPWVVHEVIRLGA
jgi:2'-5' RNA ligase